jgi:hypothetical protein
MSVLCKPVTDIVDQLPPELQQEVYDFAKYLLETKGQRKQNRLRMTWAGGLKNLRDQYTSLELQEKSLEWQDEEGAHLIGDSEA